jgi:hypothetical protein
MTGDSIHTSSVSLALSQNRDISASAANTPMLPIYEPAIGILKAGMKVKIQSNFIAK